MKAAMYELGCRVRGQVNLVCVYLYALEVQIPV